MSEPLLERRITADKGYGLFAVKDIKAGTRIIAEKPLIHMPPGSETVDLLPLLDKLTAEQYAQYTGLASHETAFVSAQKTLIRARLEVTHQGPALDAAIQNAVKMLAIYDCNSVQMGFEAKYGDGLFPTYSRMNHSCRPNTVNVWNPTIGKETIQTVRDVKAGEELTTAYFQSYDKDKQQKTLYQQWGFMCRCEVCEGDEAEASKKRRESLKHIDHGLAVHRENDTNLKMILLGQGFPHNDAEALKWAEEKVRLLNEEGLVKELLIGYRDCCEQARNVGHIPKAMAYAKKVLNIEQICLGDETDHLGDGGAKYLVEYVEGLMKEEAVKQKMNEKREAKEQKKADKKAAKKAAKGKK